MVSPGSEEIGNTWASRDLPILRAALRRLDAGEDMPDLEEIRQELGFTGNELLAGLRALESADPPYIGFDLAMGWSEDQASGHVTGVSERARRELGAWPSAESLVDALAAAFAEAADAEEEPAKKNRLRSIAEGLGDAVRDIAVSVIAKRLGEL
jgi:hypothetical protein